MTGRASTNATRVLDARKAAYGLRTFDVSRPASPKPAGGFPTPGEPYGVRVEGGLIVLPDSFSLFILK